VHRSQNVLLAASEMRYGKKTATGVLAGMEMLSAQEGLVVSFDIFVIKTIKITIDYFFSIQTCFNLFS